MEIKIDYSGLVERQTKVTEYETKGYRMLHDDFDPEWQRGQEPYGTLAFTDQEPLTAEPPRNMWDEIDELKAKVAALEQGAVKI